MCVQWGTRHGVYEVWLTFYRFQESKTRQSKTHSWHCQKTKCTRKSEKCFFFPFKIKVICDIKYYSAIGKKLAKFPESISKR